MTKSKAHLVLRNRVKATDSSHSILFYPLFFQPNLHSVIWGGGQLRKYKGLSDITEPIGESWEVSAIPSSVSIVSNGKWEGQDLNSLIDKYPDAILGKKVNEKYKGKLPLLVKLIDAKQDLSIQVHPNDEYAQRKHGKSGKSELWYVIKAEEGSRLYTGLKHKVSKEELYRHINNGSITEVLAEHKVKAGDVFYIPSGRIHSICGGIMLAEVQQSSDITYRLFDYNRKGLDGKPRELHIDMGLEAVDYKVEDNYRTLYSDCNNKAVQIVKTPYFSIRVMELSKPFHRNLLKYDSFVISLCVEGDCLIHVRSTGEDYVLREGNSTLIPAIIADYDVKPLHGKCRVLDTYIDNMRMSIFDNITYFCQRLVKSIQLFEK